MFCEQYIWARAPVLEDPIDSFQSHDRLEDLEGKTSIELQHKHVNFPSHKYLDQLSKE